MKKWILFLLAVSFFSCSSSDSNLPGDWKVISFYYQATYRVVEEDSKMAVRVMYYNDGTTKYNWNPENRWYLSTEIKKKNDVYVDATTGASKQFAKIRLKSISSDSLEMQTLAFNGIMKELWIKNKPKNYNK